MTDKVQETMREQIEVLGGMSQNAVKALNEMTMVTTEMVFDATEKTLRYGFNMVGQSDKMAQDALATYRQMYTEGLKMLQGYVQSLTDITTRSTR